MSIRGTASIPRAAALATRLGRLGVAVLLTGCCQPKFYKVKREEVCLASLSNGPMVCHAIDAKYATEFKVADKSLVELESKVIALEKMSADLDDSQRSDLLELRKTLDRTKWGLAGAGWADSRTSFDTFAKDLANLKQATVAAEASIRVGFGLTRPTRLLHFRAESFAGSGTQPPAMCAGDRILRALDEWVRKDRACKATGVTDGDWNQELLEASCSVVLHPHGCEDRYVAWIWRENDRASESDYRLYGYSRLSKECPDGDASSATEPATKIARDKNDELFKFLGQCERHP